MQLQHQIAAVFGQQIRMNVMECSSIWLYKNKKM